MDKQTYAKTQTQKTDDAAKHHQYGLKETKNKINLRDQYLQFVASLAVSNDKASVR